METKPLIPALRTLVTGLSFAVAGLLLAALPGRAAAETSCAPAATPGIERCVSGLSAASLSRIYQAQQASNWCWAASVAMILRRYGLVVPQEQVARTLLGQPANERVGIEGMAKLLSGGWRDATGHAGVASSELLPPWRQALGVSAPEVLQDLADDKPLLIGAQQHAMVLVQVTYERRIDGKAATPTGTRLLRALVLDPGSSNWLRTLQADERQPEFIARVTMRMERVGDEMASADPAPAANQ